MERTYLIAGLTVRMDTWGRTAAQAEPYLADTDAPAEICITSAPEALQARQPHLSLDDCEYLHTGISFYRQLLSHGGMLLHASAVVLDGFAYLFSAPSGTGKSTHTAQWLKTFPGALILNDDKPALRRENGRWYAYGTPWSGKTDQSRNLRIPLGGVCLLSRGETDTIQSVAAQDAIFSILEQTARPGIPAARSQLLSLLDSLLTEVPVWLLHCTPTPNAARVSQAAMSAEAHRRWG